MATPQELHDFAIGVNEALNAQDWKAIRSINNPLIKEALFQYLSEVVLEGLSAFTPDSWFSDPYRRGRGWPQAIEALYEAYQEAPESQVDSKYVAMESEIQTLKDQIAQLTEAKPEPAEEPQAESEEPAEDEPETEEEEETGEEA